MPPCFAPLLPAAGWPVPDSAQGERIDRYLARLAAGGQGPACLHACSRSALQRWLQEARVLLNGSPARPSSRLSGGDCLHLDPPQPRPSPLLPVPMDLQVLFEDGDMLALNKPGQLTVHAGAGSTGPTLVQGLLAHCDDLSGIGGELRPGIVHRLDRQTSGVIVVAKHDRAHRLLAAQFAERQVKKTYLALVLGQAPTQGEACGEIGRHRRVRQRFTSLAASRASQPPARPALTRFWRLAQGGGLSLLRLQPHTGRTHQIRVHCHDMGHPVLGDGLYGTPGAGARLGPAVRQAAAALDQQALHAHRLELAHPRDGRALCLQAPLPVGMLKLISYLKWGEGCSI